MTAPGPAVVVVGASNPRMRTCAFASAVVVASHIATDHAAAVNSPVS
jgi:hypothetical protein